MRLVRCAGIFVFALCGVVFACAASDSSLPVVVANDNRTPAGEIKDGVLRVRLELKQGRWYPGNEGGVYRDVYAFAEEGHAPQNAGPLIRVPQGTQIEATITNTLPLSAKIYGLHAHPGDVTAALTLAAGETREVRFVAGEPGTYLYWATTADHSLEDREEAETQLSGAFVVDAAGAKVEDRVFVISMWSKGTLEIPAINGKSWPNTEHLSYKVGEMPHWRVINASSSDHAMHLHGFFFSVNGVGDGEHFERYAEDQRRWGVTEHIDIGHTFEMSWNSEREGNWLFHCHMVAHITPLAEAEVKPAANAPAHEHSGGMGGLVIGITILPGAAAPVATTAKSNAPPHKIQLVISDNPEKIPLYKLEVIDPAAPAAGSKDEKPKRYLSGPPIVLVRGEPAEIEVKNESGHETAIHWHGMELESYYDGVPGWTGSGQQITPPIAPGGSFVARMTPARAGTFIYHSHAHDDTQLVNALYGPLIVLEPGQKYDPEHDKTFVFGLGKYSPLPTMLLINGSPEPYPVKLKAGTPCRLRLINITDNISVLRVRLVANDARVQWKVVAKDGADLPAAQIKASPAEMLISVGETYDVEYQADGPGTVDLQIWLPAFPVRVTQALMFAASK